MPRGINVYTLRLAEVKWLFTPSGSKNGSLGPAEVKCIFTPGGSNVAFYARREQSGCLRPTGVKWLFTHRNVFLYTYFENMQPQISTPPSSPSSFPPRSDYTTRRRRRRQRRNIFIVYICVCIYTYTR